MREINRDIVSAVIISSDNKILMGLGRPGTVYDNCWLIPGGGVEEGETKLITLFREIQEEVNLDLSIYEPELVQDGAKGESEKTLKETGERVLVRMDFYTYRLVIPRTADEIEAHESEELVKLQWIALGELANYKVAPPSIDLFKKLGYLE